MTSSDPNPFRDGPYQPLRYQFFAAALGSNLHLKIDLPGHSLVSRLTPTTPEHGLGPILNDL